MQKCEDGIKEKRSGVNGDNSLYCCSVQPGTSFYRRSGERHSGNQCVHEKAISADGESIICLPNKIVVEVESDKESELDAVMK